MYCRKKVLFLNESDATGVLYFAQQFKIAQETFEEFLSTQGRSWGEYLKEGEILLPVVHAEGDYLAPVQVGEEMNILLTLEKIGTTSFTLQTRLEEATSSKLLGTTSIVHVALDRKTWTKIPIPLFLKQTLSCLAPAPASAPD